MTALFQTISHGMHPCFSTKLQMPVETVLLFCLQVVQLQHHLSGVTLVPTKLDPAEKARLQIYCMLRRRARFWNTCPPSKTINEWENLQLLESERKRYIEHNLQLTLHARLFCSRSNLTSMSKDLIFFVCQGEEGARFYQLPKQIHNFKIPVISKTKTVRLIDEWEKVQL